MSAPFPADQPISEVPVGELNRRTSSVLRRVDHGDRVIVTNHGRPVAVIVPVKRAVELFVGAGETYFRSRLDSDAIPARELRGSLLP